MDASTNMSTALVANLDDISKAIQHHCPRCVADRDDIRKLSFQRIALFYHSNLGVRSAHVATPNARDGTEGAQSMHVITGLRILP